MDFNDLFVSILLRQVSLVAGEQNNNHVNPDRLNKYIMGLHNLVSCTNMMNDGGISNIDEGTMLMMLERYKLENTPVQERD